MKEQDLINKIYDLKETGRESTTKLETDEKVLARVTDGIYRLPGSALRELISNAYDADAELVTIETGAPRFDSMTIRDDGNGMSIESLVNLVNHIGGSAKRSEKGKNLNVTDPFNANKSPKKGRQLIGKIGIGLFSVAQLTRDFEIITKQKGDDFYLHAKIRMFNYSEDYIREQEKKASLENRGASFEAGEVSIWTESADNINSHGTDIILKNIKKSASDLLRSADIWGQKNAETDEDSTDDISNSSKLEAPIYHIGCVDGEYGSEMYISEERKPSLPWNDGDLPSVKFQKLYKSILEKTGATVSPKLDIVLDHYLYMIWTLGLSIPANYIDGHPLCASLEEVPKQYLISNKVKGQASEVNEKDGVKPKLDKQFEEYNKRIDFKVVIDGIEIFRPVKYIDLPSGNGAVKDPILFFGSYTPNLKSLSLHDGAGELSFDAYILWAPRIIPTDHNGAIIRIHNASGILFDSTFMKYQVAEHAIKKQLSIEIFIKKGLDSALNIDRESFNISHPHYQLVQRWLHQAIRQVINKYKTIKKEANKLVKDEEQSEYQNNLNSIVNTRMERLGIDPTEKLRIEVVDEIPDIFDKRDSNFKIRKSDFIESASLTPSTFKHHKGQKLEAKIEAVVQLLHGYGLLEILSEDKQNDLVQDLIQIISKDV